MVDHASNLRPSILPRARRPAHARAPTRPPRGPRPASSTSAGPMRVHRPLDDARQSPVNAEPAVEEPRHGDLVRRVQHDRQAAARPRARGTPAAGTGNASVSGASNSSRPAAREVERRQRRRPPLRIRERVLNRQPHVGHAELRDDRPVGQLDHRVHDRLRMDDDVDPIGAPTPNSQCASITSSPLFISVAESIVIFRPIRQVGCCSASVGGHRARDRDAAAAAERSARRGQDRAAAPRPRSRPCRHW